jgi:hypothetical protein
MPGVGPSENYMNDPSRQRQPLAGPPSWANWRAMYEGVPTSGVVEVPLYSDAWTIGELTTGLSPYEFFSTVAEHHGHGIVGAAELLMLMMQSRWSERRACIRMCSGWRRASRISPGSCLSRQSKPQPIVGRRRKMNRCYVCAVATPISLKEAKRARAPAIEAYPLDRNLTPRRRPLGSPRRSSAPDSRRWLAECHLAQSCGTI